MILVTTMITDFGFSFTFMTYGAWDTILQLEDECAFLCGGTNKCKTRKCKKTCVRAIDALQLTCRCLIEQP